MSGPILLAAGGTGGHVFPAQAVAAELAARGRQLAVVTDRRGENYSGMFAAAPVYQISAGTPSAAGIAGKLKALAAIAAGIVQAWLLCRRIVPAAVIGFGGYPSLPTMIAAILLRLPRAVHEQNAVLGRVNRLVAGRVDAIATSFSRVRALPEDGAARVVHTGNPVRPAIAELAAATYAAPAPGGAVRLLVFGGSQGAAILSQTVPQAVAALPEDIRARVSVVQQARPEDVAAVRAAYDAAGIAAEIDSFFADMPARLAEAHLVIARAGAGTVSEIACAGRPALLVPFAHAMDDHQTDNARDLVEAGAARLLPQSSLSSEVLTAAMAEWLADPAALTAAARAAHGIARPDAAARLADLVEWLADGKSVPVGTREAAA
jgi:UDP-N-acetylglucosamine--N-acetylmuramyl-(pentapeptide) pyrophosphoryl-undecaprenol N-acetylglucosamine transferase